MQCYVCKKEIESLSKASRVGVGGGLSLMGHDRCWAALNAVASPEPAPEPARPMGKTINKSYDPALSPEETAIAISKVVDFSDTPVGSTMEYKGNHFVVGWNKKGLQPWHPSEQWLQEAAKKGVR